MLQNTITPPVPAEFKQREDKFVARLFAERGDIYFQLGRYDAAIADYAKSGKLDPATKDASEKRIIAAGQMKTSSPK